MKQQLRLVYAEPRTWELTNLEKERARRGIAACRKALNATQPFLWDNNTAA
ncbi:MAG: hypothetical protein P8L22_00450 [Acidimicrobiales bacterium]|nr:hypothetical protein [Acidimicrobiales bacterium]